MLSNPEKLSIMGENARETIPKPWDTIIDKVVDRYQYLIDHHTPNRFKVEEISDWIRSVVPSVSDLFNDD